MWFKNLRLYRLTDDWTVNEDRLNEALAQFPFTGLTALQESAFGWVPPFADSQLLCENVGGRLFMAAQIQEKLLPSSVLKEHLDERVIAIEEAEGRRPGRKEKEALKETVRAELLPRAFHKTRRVSLWIDPSRHWLVLNAASEKTADEVTAHLRDAIGSLPIVPLGKLIAGGDLLTAWFQDPSRRPEGTELSADLELVMAQDPTVKARYRNLDLDAPEIRHSLDSGMRIKQLGVVLNDQCQAVIDDAFALKRLKYSDSLIETGDDSDDPRTDALLMSDTLTAWLNALESQIAEPGV
ncbi:recombination-associated protein RdgC [Saccharospirillum mangrovi]|uniref:recombination-associated protein RdgC n=1 Tax=Saccharospirillum mangrovi TaxID=2161747 RepID=UPI000D369E20|nr:recombination-associated protein RdgC [Saccharospirillum mangrovi]